MSCAESMISRMLGEMQKPSLLPCRIVVTTHAIAHACFLQGCPVVITNKRSLQGL